MASATASAEPSRASTPSVPATPEKVPDDSSKLRTFLGVLKKFIGVSDLAAVRFSLPAQLLEPTPNLEYWNYLDRPETFISIPDHDEPIDRVLAVLRFWFTKDLKYVKGRPCKPYNSTLGEFFRCTWEVEPASAIRSTPTPSIAPSTKSGANSSAASVKSVASFKSADSTLAIPPSTSAANNTASPNTSGKIRLAYLTEQTSHHPPVSAFWIDCPEKGITARGYDQLSAKFTGTSIRVTPGAHNLGIYINLKDGEEYLLTHPAVHLGGFLRGSLTLSVADTCYISCARTKIKVILEYLEEGWLGKAQNKVQGVIFKYDPSNDTKQKIRDVAEKDVLGRIEGSWTDKLYYTLGSQPFAKTADKILLIDLQPLSQTPKNIPPLDVQLPNESIRFWNDVTQAIVSKQFNQATTLKQEIEEKQRNRAAERKNDGKEWKPRFFTGATTPVGRPELTADGQKAVESMLHDKWELQDSEEHGAF